MPCPGALCRAALLLSLCLQLQGRPPATAPLSPGEGPHSDKASPKTQDMMAKEMKARSLTETDPDEAARTDDRDGLFQDVDPKALAALLLQALDLQPKNANEGRLDHEPGTNEERVRSETRSSDLPPERQQGWGTREEEEEEEEEEERAQSREEEQQQEGAPGQQEAETLESLLQELRRYSTPAKREEHVPQPRAAASSSPEGTQDEVLKELEEYGQLRVHSKRKALPSEPWDGARKLRQQQHLEHQLLQRRYEELAESRRQAEEARRAAAEEERLADMASDLLLQYLLKDGEESAEEGRPGSEGGSQKGSSGLLFEDEEGNVAEDKRSNEAPEEDDDGDEDDEDIDPNTIDRLIELSSKLHLPADDVIDIINDVEKKKKEVPEPLGKGKTPPPFGPQQKPKKTPPYPAYPQGPKTLQKPYPPPAPQPPRRRLPKEDEDAWNEVLRGDEYPSPKWFRAKGGDDIISNYINPRTFQPPPPRRYAHLPIGPMVPRDDEYYHDSRARDEEEEEELENYIEKVLMKRPMGF